MTDKTETALDLDGLMRQSYRDYEAECAIAGVPVTLQAERIAFEAGWNYLAQAQRDQIAAKDAKIAELTERLKELNALLNASEIRLSQKQGLADADAHAARRLNIHQ